jgi:hypothetical protein
MMLTVRFHSSPIVEKTQYSTTISVMDNVIPPREGTYSNVAEIARGLAAYTEEVKKRGKPARVGVIDRKQRGERKPAGFDKWRNQEGSIDVCLEALPAKDAA